MTPLYIQRPVIQEEYVNPNARLPYSLTVSEVIQAMQSTYDFLHDINAFLVGRGYPRLEDMFLGNSFAGLLSEVLVKNLGDASQTLTPNLKVGGFPDLIGRGQHPKNAVLRAEEGIEVKASKQRGGWQGHNPERAGISFSVIRLTWKASLFKNAPQRISSKSWRQSCNNRIGVSAGVSANHGGPTLLQSQKRECISSG